MTLTLQEANPSGGGDHYFLIDHSIFSNHTNTIRTEPGLLAGDANLNTFHKGFPYTHRRLLTGNLDAEQEGNVKGTADR